MCIICNCRTPMPGISFLALFEQASEAMKKAKEAMLVCSKETEDPEISRRYDHVHKRMTHLLKEWNALEHIRENFVVSRQLTQGEKDVLNTAHLASVKNVRLIPGQRPEGCTCLSELEDDAYEPGGPMSGRKRPDPCKLHSPSKEPNHD